MFWIGKKGDILPGKRKAGASSRTPHAVIYDDKYITNWGKVKEKLPMIVLMGASNFVQVSSISGVS